MDSDCPTAGAKLVKAKNNKVAVDNIKGFITKILIPIP
jgi:hypothetical protein